MEQIDKENECPPLPPAENIQAAMWKLLNQVNSKLGTLLNEHTVVWNDLYADGGLTEKVSKFETVMDEVTTVSAEQGQLRFEMSMYRSLALKQQDQIHELQKRCLNLEARSMSDNIIIHNETELPKENPVTVVKTSPTKAGHCKSGHYKDRPSTLIRTNCRHPSSPPCGQNTQPR